MANINNTGSNNTIVDVNEANFGGDLSVETDKFTVDEATGDGYFAKTLNVNDRISLYEDSINGGNFIGLQAPAALAGNTTFTFPDGDGSANQVLGTDGSAQLQWQTVPVGVAANYLVETVTSGEFPYTIQDDDEIRHFLCEVGNSSKTIYLPLATNNTNRMITIKVSASSAASAIVTRQSTDTIDSGTTLVVPGGSGGSGPGDAVTFVSDGTDWWIIGRYNEST